MQLLRTSLMHLSIKPTAFGLLIDKEKAWRILNHWSDKQRSMICLYALIWKIICVTSETIRVVIDLHKKGLTNVGTVLQGRLHRTPEDIQDVASHLGPNADYRICKGIYLEPEDIAYVSRQDIRRKRMKQFEWGAWCLCWDCIS